MTLEQFKKGQELLTLIEVTERGLNHLKQIKVRERLDNKFYEDSNYNLYISEYSESHNKDGSLSRYYGNERLLAVIVRELEIQLKELKDLFENL